MRKMKKQNISTNFDVQRIGRGKYTRGSKKRPNIVTSSQERGRFKGKSSGLGNIKNRLGEAVGRGGREVNAGNKPRGSGRRRGLAFGGRSVVVEEDDDEDEVEDMFNNSDQRNLNFEINENLQLPPSVQFMGGDPPVQFMGGDPPVQFMENDPPVQFMERDSPVIIMDDPNENFDGNFGEPFEEERENRDVIDRRSKGSIERDLLKLDRERVEDLMYEEEQKRYENERQTVEKERKELENLRKSIEEEKRKVELLKRQAEEEERQREREINRRERDSRKSYDDSNNGGDDRYKYKDSRLISKENIGLKLQDSHKKEPSYGNNNKRILPKTSTEGSHPSSNRMTASFLKGLTSSDNAAFLKGLTSSDKYPQATRSPSVDRYHRSTKRTPSVDRYHRSSNRSPSLNRYPQISKRSPSVEKYHRSADRLSIVDKYGQSSNRSPNVDKYRRSSNRSPSVDKYFGSSNRSPSVDKYRRSNKSPPDQSSTRMSAAGFLQLLHKQARPEDDRKSSNVPRKEKVDSNKRDNRPQKESRPFSSNDGPSKRTFDIMQGPKSDSMRGNEYDMVYRSENNGNRIGTNQDTNQSRYNEFSREYDSHSKQQRSDGLESGVWYGSTNETSHFHNASREGFDINQRGERFGGGLQRGSGFQEDRGLTNQRVSGLQRGSGFQEDRGLTNQRVGGGLQRGSGFQEERGLTNQRVGGDLQRGSGFQEERGRTNQREGELHKSLQRGNGFPDSRERFQNDGGGYNEYSRSQSNQREGRYDDISRVVNPNQRSSEFSQLQSSEGGFIAASKGSGGFVDSASGFPPNDAWGAYKSNKTSAGGGFNSDLSRGFSSNSDLRLGFALNQQSSSSTGLGLYQDHSGGRMGSTTDSGQFSQLHQGHFPTGMQNVDTTRNSKMGGGEMYGSSGTFNAFSAGSSRDERGFGQDSMGREPLSSRSFREKEYGFRGGESSSNNYSSTSAFGSSFGNASRFETSREPTHSAPWSSSMAPEFSGNKYEKMREETPNANPFPPPPFQGKRTEDERVQKLSQRKKKKLQKAQRKLRPHQHTMIEYIDREIQQIDFDLRKVNEKCYEQGQKVKYSYS